MRTVLLWIIAMSCAAPLVAVEKTTSPVKLSPQIAEGLREISPKNIEATIRKLVSFGTRHTLSDATSETRGIGAARRWIQSEFERYSKDVDGRLEVMMDEFTQPPGERNPEPVQVVNVVATLPGSQPGVARSHLRCHRALRLSRQRPNERDRRCARSE